MMEHGGTLGESVSGASGGTENMKIFHLGQGGKKTLTRAIRKM
jgi:hypothetical protein